MPTHLARWTPEMDACMAIGINNGLSARLIVDELGVTRNAVLGRLFRLGLCKSKDGSRQPKVTHPNKGRPPGALNKRDSVERLGLAARACGFTVADLEEIRKDIEESRL